MPDSTHKWEVDIDSGLTVTFPSNHAFEVGNTNVGLASIPEPNLKDLIKVIVNLSNRLTDKRDIN